VQESHHDLTAFWNRRRIDVAVAGDNTEVLLGVREGFLRYFREALGRPVTVGVVPQPDEAERSGLPVSDEATLESARRRCALLREHLGEQHLFHVASSGGLQTVTSGDDRRVFIRCWTVVLGPGGEAWGASGSQQLPEELWRSVEGGGSGKRAGTLFTVPGKRRRGGMLSSLTGRLETRRSAVALSTVHALSTLFYGILESGARQ